MSRFTAGVVLVMLAFSGLVNPWIFPVRIADAAPSVATNAASNVTSSAARLNGTVSGSGGGGGGGTQVTVEDTTFTDSDTDDIDEVSVAKPTGLQNGDVLLSWVAIGGEAPSTTPPSGFTSIQEVVDPAGETRVNVAYKMITDAAGEPASYSWPTAADRGGVGMTILRGVDTDNIANDTASAYGDDDLNGEVIAPSVDVNDGGAVLHFVAHDAAAGQLSVPGWSIEADDTSDGPSSADSYVSYQEFATGTATGAVDYNVITDFSLLAIAFNGDGGYPQVESITSEAFSAYTTTHNVNMPATTASGDLLLLMFTNAEDGAIPNTPSGWTAVYRAGCCANDMHSSVFAKVADGSEGGTEVDVSTSGTQEATAKVIRILAADWYGSIADGIAAGTPVGDDDDGADPPSLSPAWGAANTLWIAHLGSTSNTGDTEGMVVEYPASYTGGEQILTTSNEAAVAVAFREQNIATENPGAFEKDGVAEAIANTIAIRPNEGGGGGDTDYYFRYRSTDPSVTCTDSDMWGAKTATQSSTDPSGLAFQQDIGSLSASTQYWYCAFVTDAGGSADGGVITFTTGAPMAATCANAGWTCTIVTAIDAVGSQGTALAFDGDGNAAILYQNTTGDDHLKAAGYTGSGSETSCGMGGSASWDCETIDNPGGALVGTHPSSEVNNVAATIRLFRVGDDPANAKVIGVNRQGGILVSD